MSKNINVCVVDDDDIFQFTMKLTLKHINTINDIKMFKDGLEAMDFMMENLNNEKELPDVLFLDINMPVMDGFQFIEEYIKIKPKVGKKIRIFMLSSSIDPVDIEKVKHINEISGYITKPIRQNQIEDILQNKIP